MRVEEKGNASAAKGMNCVLCYRQLQDNQSDDVLCSGSLQLNEGGGGSVVMLDVEGKRRICAEVEGGEAFIGRTAHWLWSHRSFECLRL